jgi:hypothetical protein
VFGALPGLSPEAFAALRKERGRLRRVIRRKTGQYLAYSGEFSEYLREKVICRKSEEAKRVF